MPRRAAAEAETTASGEGSSMRCPVCFSRFTAEVLARHAVRRHSPKPVIRMVRRPAEVTVPTESCEVVALPGARLLCSACLFNTIGARRARVPTAQQAFSCSAGFQLVPSLTGLAARSDMVLFFLDSPGA